MKKLGLLIAVMIYFLGLYYLLLPLPANLPPLPNSFRSDEPGDTWQNPDQQAYYTNLTREEILKFYTDRFALKIGSYTIPSYRLNYRPEDTAQYLRPHILAYYLEEIVHPFRESLFVGGWNARLSPISADLFDAQYERWAMIREGKEYQTKVTLKSYHSSPLGSIIVWTLVFPATFFVFRQFKYSLSDLFT